MGVITGGNLLSSGEVGPFAMAGVPSAGTSEVVNIAITGTPTGGTFKIKYQGLLSDAIAYNADAAAMQAGLESIDSIGTSNATVSGTDPYAATFAAALGKLDASALTLGENNLTGGTSPTVTFTVATPGVDASFRGCSKGALVVDTTNGILYINTGTAAAPTWTKVGTQT